MKRRHFWEVKIYFFGLLSFPVQTPCYQALSENHPFYFLFCIDNCITNSPCQLEFPPASVFFLPNFATKVCLSDYVFALSLSWNRTPIRPLEIEFQTPPPANPHGSRRCRVARDAPPVLRLLRGPTPQLIPNSWQPWHSYCKRDRPTQNGEVIHRKPT